MAFFIELAVLAFPGSDFVEVGFTLIKLISEAIADIINLDNHVFVF